MSLMRLATARKAIDQVSSAQLPVGGVYLPIENRSTWTEYTGGHDAALAIATFYACVRVLAESVAQISLPIYRHLGKGAKERARDHELYPVLHDTPNPSMTSFVWRELLMSHMATWGNHYSEIVFDGMGRMQLWPIRPDRIESRWGTGLYQGQKLYTYLSPMGVRTEMRPGSVFHVPGLSGDGLRGFSPVELHRKTMRVHESARQYAQSTFDNNARPAVMFSHPRNLSEGAITRLAGQMEELRGARNAGKSVVVEEGMTIHEIGIPPKDAQYIEARVHESREIQRIMRMQPHMVGDLERSTNNNIEQQSLEFVMYTLTPWLKRIEQEINAQLLIDQPDYFAEFNVDSLLRGDAKGRAEALAVRWRHGTLSPDEWRAKEGDNPLPDGLGERYYTPVNYAAIAEEEEEPEAAEPMEAGDEEPAGEPPKLVAVKSATVRCPDCGRLLAELATPPYRFTCTNSKCKSKVEAA